MGSAERAGSVGRLLAAGTQEWVKALSDAVHAGKSRGGGWQEVAADFLTAIDGLFSLEHQADDAERALTHAAVKSASDFRQLHLYAEVGRNLEEAADALNRAGLMARDYVLGTALSA